MSQVHPEGGADTSDGDRGEAVTDESGIEAPPGSVVSNEEERKALQDMLLSGPYSRSQIWLSETLARLHPELTMPIFSGQSDAALVFPATVT